jgi:glycosyltransferase involved in cell wall biosynthesis
MSQAMRLLFVNYEFPPVGGGAAYASLATARELVGMGHEVDFLTTATDGRSGDAVEEGVRVHRVRSFRRGVHQSGVFGAASFLVFAAARLGTLARARRYDAYHYYFSLPTGLLSRVPGAHRAQPYVVSLRGSDVPGYDRALLRQHRLLMPVTRRIWRGAYRVVANSADLRRLALASVPGTRIEVILNGTHPSTVLAYPRETRTGVRVLTVSRLIARKGLDTLIRALQRTPHDLLSLDIAGDGPDAEELKRLVRSSGLADRVRFHGFADRAALAKLHESADVFVLSSRSESCSMALLEAMAAGLPLVATSVGGNSEIVRDGYNGLLFKPQDDEALAAALRTLAGNPALRQRFGGASRSLAVQRFSWHAVARRYEMIFLEATGQRGSGLRRGAEATVARDGLAQS